MADIMLTPQAREILEQSVTQVLIAKGVTVSVSHKTASEITSVFSEKLGQYLDQVTTENQLAIIREVLKQIH
jgi:hypothetical protein